MLLWNEKGSKDFQGGHPFKHILLTSDFPKGEMQRSSITVHCVLILAVLGGALGCFIKYAVCSLEFGIRPVECVVQTIRRSR